MSASSKKWTYGVDVWTPVTRDQFRNMHDAGYQTAFVRIYTPSEGGRRDSNGKNNVLNALAAGLGVEVFVQPAPPTSARGGKSGGKQFDEAYAYLTENSIGAGSIWLMVTQPNAWSATSPSENVAFIESFLDKARSNNLHVGIYTNWYDWHLITNAYKEVERGGVVMLWYWHVLGVGPDAETIHGYSDFRPFGSWSQPDIKQFGIIESVAGGVTVNRNIYLGAASGDDDLVIGGGGKSSFLATAGPKSIKFGPQKAEENMRLAAEFLAGGAKAGQQAKGKPALVVGGAHFTRAAGGGGSAKEVGSGSGGGVVGHGTGALYGY